MDAWRLGDELHDISKMRSNLICTRIRMPGLKNQIRIPRIILILAQWSSKPPDESCPRAVELAPYRGFVGIRGSVWLCLVYLSIYCGLLHLMLRPVRGIFVLRPPYDAA